MPFTNAGIECRGLRLYMGLLGASIVNNILDLLPSAANDLKLQIIYCSILLQLVFLS